MKRHLGRVFFKLKSIEIKLVMFGFVFLLIGISFLFWAFFSNSTHLITIHVKEKNVLEVSAPKSDLVGFQYIIHTDDHGEFMTTKHLFYLMEVGKEYAVLVESFGIEAWPKKLTKIESEIRGIE